MKYLKYISWFPLFILSFIVTLTAYPIVPIACLFAIGSDKLPKLFFWYGTFDNTIDGDEGHLKRWDSFVSKMTKYHLKHLGIYIRRVAWLWRNKAYNFSYYVTGRVIERPIKVSGRPDVDSTSPEKSGKVLITSENAWCLFVSKHLFDAFGKKIYIRVYLGWKMKQLAEKDDGKEFRAMLADYFFGFRTFDK